LVAHEVSSFAATTHVKPAANAEIYKHAFGRAQVKRPPAFGSGVAGSAGAG
jgi:hypothetical protein